MVRRLGAGGGNILLRRATGDGTSRGGEVASDRPERIEYDDVGMFHDHAAGSGSAYDGPPVVRRVFVDVDETRKLSALVWAEDDPEVVFLHGGAQNAHTW